MVSQEWADKAVALLERYRDDPKALDAFIQLASDPSSATAYHKGYAKWDRLAESVTDNLALRWSMSKAAATDLVREISAETSGWIGDVGVDRATHRWMDGSGGESLRKAILERLQTSNDRVYKLVQVMAAYLEQGELKGGLREYHWESLLAAYVAAWGEPPPRTLLKDALVHSGLCSPLPYASSTGHTFETVLALSPAFTPSSIAPFLAEQQVADVLTSLESRQDWEALRLLDEVTTHRDVFPGHALATSLSGVPRPLPGILGQYGNVCAISPFCASALRQGLAELKRRLLTDTVARVDAKLTLERNRRWPAADCNPISVFGTEPERWWRWTATGATPVLVWLTPWTLRGSLSGASRAIPIGRHELVVVTTHQSVPSVREFMNAAGASALLDIILHVPQSAGAGVLHGTPSQESQTVASLLTSEAKRRGEPSSETRLTPRPEEQGGAPPTSSDRATRETVYIGNAIRSDEAVTWQPGKGVQVRQPNRNVLIVGKPGTGKSQLIKAFVHELSRQGVPSIVLDWANEYTDVLPHKVDARQGITINPLELPAGSTPYQTALEISSIVGAVFSGLGDIQEALLRDAVLEAYERKGILENRPETWKLEPPTFEDVVNTLQSASSGGQKVAAQGLLARVTPFVALRLFTGATTVPFEQLVSGGTSVLLGGLYTDDLRVVYGHFFLNKLWYYVQNLGLTDKARFYLLLDEANRMDFPGSPLERLVREARKFGVGIIVASQRPGDFTETVPANVACSIVFQCPLERDAAFMAKQLNCRPSDIQGLRPTFDALVKFDAEGETKRVTVIPYYQRRNAK
jgi:hypothetical protein